MKNHIQHQGNSVTLEHQNHQMLVVIDPGVTDSWMLAAGVQKGAEVVFLDPKQDGFEQITAAIKRRTNISSLHIICHGSPGCLELGATKLSLDNLNHYDASQWQIWSNAISGASLLLYGCQVASDKTGQAFLQRLHQLTGANIVASQERVGSAALGGSWALEYQIGQIESELAFLPEVRQAYSGVFQPVIELTTGPATLIETEGTVFNFNFSLSEPPPAGGVTVTVAGNLPQSLTQLDLGSLDVTGGNTPVGDIDFSGFNFTITAQTATISLPIYLDDDLEGIQTVTYTLQPGTGYTVSSSASSGTVQFADDPSQITPAVPEVGLTASSTTLAEGGNTTLTFSLSVPPSAEGVVVTVDSDVPDSLAEFDVLAAALDGAEIVSANDDLSGFSLRLNAQTATVSLPVFDDTNIEGTESITYSIQAGEGYTIAPAASAITFTIEDNDAAPPPPPSSPTVPELGLTASPTTLVEGGSTTLTFSLNAPPPAEGVVVTVDSDVPNSLAEFDVFAAAFNGAELISANDDSSGFSLRLNAQTATVSLPVFSDTTDELSESITYSLQSGEGYTVASAASSINFTIEDAPDVSNPITISLNSQNNIFLINGLSTQTTNLQFDFVSRGTDIFNEVGFFEVDDDNGGIDTNDDGVIDLNPGDPNYATQALTRGQVIASSAADNSLPNSTTIATGLTGGTRLAFYLVPNSTSDNVLNAQTPPESVIFGSSIANSGSEQLRVSNPSTDGEFTLSFEDQEGGNQDFNDLVLNFGLSDQGLPPGAALQSFQQGELFDLRGADLDSDGVVDTEVTASIAVSSEAAYDNSVGLYLVDNENGQIGDLLPSDPGYAAAAIQRSVLSFNRDGTDPINLSGNQLGLLAPYIIADSTPEDFLATNPNNQGVENPIAYFNYLGANPDSFDHVALIGNNTFGFEDLFGGGDRDVNDIIFRVDFT